MTATGYRYDAGAFRAVFEQHFTYLAGVARNAHRYAERTALHDPADGRRWSYAELWADAGRVATGLAQRGVAPGDVVVFSLFNSPEFVLAWLGAQRLGAIASPINFRLSPGEVAHVLDDSRPAAFLYDATLGATAEQALTIAGHRPGLRLTTGPGSDGVEPFAALLTSNGPPPAEPGTGVYDETTRLYTSGTTGMPKGVSLNSLVEVLSAHDVIMHFPLTPEDRTLNMSPGFTAAACTRAGPTPFCTSVPRACRCASSIRRACSTSSRSAGSPF